MEQKAKFIIIGLIGIAVVCAFLFIQALGTNQHLARERDEFKVENTNLTAKIDKLTSSLRSYESRISSLSGELEKVRQEKEEIERKYELVNSAREELVEKLKVQAQQARPDLEKKLQDMQDEKSALERRVSEMEAMLTERLSQINSLKEKIESAKAGVINEEGKESVELPAIVVKPKAIALTDQEGTGAILMGRVMAVNKENNFVIVDLGEEAGVKIGDAFRVYRSDKPIANIEAIQVRRSISACDIKKQGMAIKIGDIVR